MLHPWLKGHLLQVLAELDRDPLPVRVPVRVPLPEQHLLLRT